MSLIKRDSYGLERRSTKEQAGGALAIVGAGGLALCGLAALLPFVGVAGLCVLLLLVGVALKVFG